jgi:hypothetical protein
MVAGVVVNTRLREGGLIEIGNGALRLAATASSSVETFMLTF